MEQLQSHKGLSDSSYMGKYLRVSSYIIGSPFSYTTLQLLHISVYIRKFYFLFYQCRTTEFGEVKNPTLYKYRVFTALHSAHYF